MVLYGAFSVFAAVQPVPHLKEDMLVEAAESYPDQGQGSNAQTLERSLTLTRRVRGLREREVLLNYLLSAWNFPVGKG